MSSDSQREPFLGYTDHDDDEDTAKSEARHYRNVQRKGHNYLPYLMLVLVTSFFWAGLFYLFHPTATTTTTDQCHSSSSSADNNNTNPNPHPNSGGFTATIPIPTSPQISTTHPNGPLADGSSTPAAATTISSSTDRLNITSNATLLTCGSTVPQAKSNNCKYDILLNNWVPAPCYSQEFVDEYVDENNYSEANGWGGFADEAMTRRLTLQQMSEGPFYWTSLRDHVTHCAVMWKKQFATMYEFEAKGVLDTVLASYGHTDHCAQYLMDSSWRNWTGPTKTEMGFAGCWVRNSK